MLTITDMSYNHTHTHTHTPARSLIMYECKGDCNIVGNGGVTNQSVM